MNRNKLQRTLEAALAHHHAARLDEAARLYAQVCRALPKLYDGWYLAGALAFQRGGHLTEAADLLTRALRIQPGSAECKLFLGMTLADLGRYAEAEKPLRAALEKLPGYPEAWENLADTLCALGQPDEAAACLRRALALRPDNAGISQRLDELQLSAAAVC